jgi:hypothetical protein
MMADCFGIAYSRLHMSYIPTLVSSLETRLAELTNEIVRLEAGLAILDNGTVTPPAPTDPPRRAKQSRRRLPATPTQTAPPSTSPEPVAATVEVEPAVTPPSDAKSPPRPQRRSAAAARPQRKRAAGKANPEGLERLLADTTGGMSATVLAEKAGAGYSSTLALLRELEAAGQVRRSGARRTTVWRLITDEERIAQRAAELEAVAVDVPRRRGRARVS